jgi:hypothetical protein
MAPIQRQPTPKDNSGLAEQFFNQVSESIQLVFDLTSRIDERVKMLIERQNEIDERVEKIIEMQQHAIHRLTIIETKELPAAINSIDDRVKKLELKEEMNAIRSTTHNNRWLFIFDAVWKIVLMCVAGYILYKLGIQAPPM